MAGAASMKRQSQDGSTAMDAAVAMRALPERAMSRERSHVSMAMISMAYDSQSLGGRGTTKYLAANDKSARNRTNLRTRINDLRILRVHGRAAVPGVSGVTLSAPEKNCDCVHGRAAVPGVSGTIRTHRGMPYENVSECAVPSGPWRLIACCRTESARPGVADGGDVSTTRRASAR